MAGSTESFYNSFSFLYPVVDTFFMRRKKLLYREIERLPTGRLLEIGVGNGSNLPYYSRHALTGIDTSSTMLEAARKRRDCSAELLLMNGERMFFPDNYFDYIILSHVLAVVDHPEQVLSEVYRVLKPGGRVFILNHFTPRNWLAYIDQAFQRISKLFHFNSLFCLSELHTLARFSLLHEISFGPLAYFKLLIYQKK